MNESVAIVTLHGMGRTRKDYADKLFAGLRSRLAGEARQVYFHAIFYQTVLQENQERLWDEMSKQQRLDSQWARQFLLFNLADAVGLEAGKDHPQSSYLATQAQIAVALLAAKARTAGGPLVIVAQSLGGQVFSSYLWDAQRWRDMPEKPPTAGIWTRGRHSIAEALNRPISDDDVAYLRGDTLCTLVTTGCNIPVFVAAHKPMVVKAIRRPSDGFEWHNYFDRDDVLGWPLQPLNDGYRGLVHDHSINSGGLFESWNWRSHLRYWEDGDVLDGVIRHLRRAVALRPPASQGAPQADSDL